MRADLMSEEERKRGREKLKDAEDRIETFLNNISDTPRKDVNITNLELYSQEKYIFIIDNNIASIKRLPTLENTEQQNEGVLWKAYGALSDSRIFPTVKNEVMHPYIKEFFDLAVRENMGLDGLYQEIRNKVNVESLTCYFEGNVDICRFLKAYRICKEEMAKQGKEIFIPDTFKEYPVLQDIAEGIYRSNDGKIAAHENIDGTIQFEKSYIVSLSEQEKRRLLEKTHSRDFAVAILESGVKDVDFSKIKARLTEEDKSKFKDIKIQELSKKLAETKARLEQQEREVAKRETTIRTERASSVNIAENVKNLTDEQRKDNFAAKKKLMEEHPIMLEPCLNSMCESYVATKDEAIKNEMLSDLYAVRKGGNTNAEKREMAKTFKRVLDKNTSLQKDENLVALSKIDTIVSQPTKSVKNRLHIDSARNLRG